MKLSAKLSIVNIFSIIIFCMTAAAGEEKSAALTTVDKVDLARYVGTWYEIAKIPNRFQKKCAMNTTATYTLQPDGKILVTNRCQKEDGRFKEAVGIAKVVDIKSSAKLKVSFVRFLGISLFWGDYWIIGLDSDYQWAIVGSPSRKYGWILSRTPQIPDSDLQQINRILQEKGYTEKDFEFTRQSDE